LSGKVRTADGHPRAELLFGLFSLGSTGQQGRHVPITFEFLGGERVMIYSSNDLAISVLCKMLPQLYRNSY